MKKAEENETARTAGDTAGIPSASDRKERPAVSVIIPVYNTAPYIRQCLDSVLNQTYTNLEVFLIDDGSTDGSAQICDEYAADARVRVFHTENHGISEARNLGLDSASGEYIGFVDSDDWIEPCAYERMVKVATETDAEITVSKTFSDYRDCSIPSAEPGDEVRSFCGEAAVSAYASGIFREFVWNKIYKAEIFSDTRFPAGHTFEDLYIMPQLMLRASGDCGIVSFIPENLFHYRMRKSSIVHSYGDLGNLTDRWHAYLKKYDVLTDHRDKVLPQCYYAIGIMWMNYSGLKRSEKKEASEIVRDMHAFSKAHFREMMKGNYPKTGKLFCLVSQTRSKAVMLACRCAGKIMMTFRRSGRRPFD